MLLIIYVKSLKLGHCCSRLAKGLPYAQKAMGTLLNSRRLKAAYLWWKKSSKNFPPDAGGLQVVSQCEVHRQSHPLFRYRSKKRKRGESRDYCSQKEGSNYRLAPADSDFAGTPDGLSCGRPFFFVTHEVVIWRSIK